MNCNAACNRSLQIRLNLTWMKSWIADGDPSFFKDVKQCSLSSVIETQEKNFGILMIQACCHRSMRSSAEQK
jgi:hypothetical protein